MQCSINTATDPQRGPALLQALCESPVFCAVNAAVAWCWVDAVRAKLDGAAHAVAAYPVQAECACSSYQLYSVGQLCIVNINVALRGADVFMPS